MSKTVDDRVVEMQFDNSKFEKNVQTTLSTLDKLKQGLNLLGAAKGLDDVADSSKKVDLSSILAATQSLSSRFSALGIVAIGALEEIGRKAVTIGQNLVKSLAIDPITDGFKEYELKMGSVQTIMASTGADLDQVMGKLNELNAYADRTIYSFSDMTTSIGKFTNAGVDLDTSVAAIQGVANVAAVSGANAGEASRAMYNFAQALSAGYVKLIDWKSIENANMATVEFKNQLLESAVAAGTVEKTADGMYRVLGTNAQGATMKETISATKNFNDSLSYQWMTTEVLTSTLAKYSDEATEIGKKAFAAAQDVKTFSQLMDTLKEAVGSGWAETWEIVFGNFEEAKALWTSVNNVVSGIIDRHAKARNELLSTWKNAGGREDLLAAFSNIYKQISGITKAIKKAFTDMFPPATAGSLWKITKRFRDFTETLDLVHEKFFAIRSEDGENIVRTFKGIFAVIGIVKDVVVALIKPLGALFSGFGEASSGILGLTGDMGDYLVNLKDIIEQSGILEKITERLSGVFKAVGSFISNLVGSIRRFIGLLKFDGVFASIDFLKNILTNVTEFIFALVSALTGKDLSNAKDSVVGFINKIGDGLYSFWTIIKPAIDGIIGLFSGASGPIKEFFSSLKSIDFKPASDLSDKTEKAFSPLKSLFDGLKKLFQGIGQLFVALKPILSGIISAVGRVLGVIGNAISEIVKNFDFSKLTEILSGGLKVGIGVKLLGFINGLKKTADKAPGVLSSIKGMFDGIKDLFGSFKEMADAKTLETKSKALKNMAIAIGILAVSLFVISSIDANALQSSMTAITFMLGELVGAVALLAKIEKKSNIKKIGQTMISMAAAVLVLSLAIKALGDLQPEQITNGLIAITVLLVEMVAATKVLSDDGKSKKMMKGAANAVIFAIALRILVSSVKALGKMDPAGLINGIVGVTILIAEMVIAAKILGNEQDASSMMKGAMNAVIFAVAIRLLVSSVKSLGKLDPANLVNGMIGVTILIAEMVVAAKILGNSDDSSSMMKGAMNALVFAVALRVLVASVKAIGNMNPDQLLVGLVGMTAVIAEMIVATKLMSQAKGGGGAMLAAAAAMLILAASLKILGTLSLDQIVNSLIAIAGVIIILAMGGRALEPCINTLLKFAGVMALIGLSAVLFGAGLLMISAALAALGGSLLLFVDAIIAAIISLIVAIPEMISALAKSLQAAVVDIVVCLVEIIKAVLIALKEVVPEAVDVLLTLILTTLQSLAENIQPIVEALLAIVVGVLNGLASGVPDIVSASVGLLKSIISALMDSIGGFDVGTILGAIAAVTLLEALMLLIAAVTITALVAVAPLPFIGKQLSKFIAAAEPFLTGIQEVDPASLEGAKALAEMILILTASGILDALTSWFTGGSSMVDFGQQLAEFAPYMKQYSDGIKGIDSEAVEASANAALALATMATNLPNSGGVVSWFTGENSLSAFADELVVFGPKLKAYADSVTGLDAEVVTNSTLAAQSLASMADNLPNSGGVVSWFTGDNSLTVFATELEAFGPSLKAYADSVSGLDSEVVTNSTLAAQSLASLADNLPNSGGVVSWFTGDNTLSAFATELEAFGPSLKAYADSISGIDSEAVTSSANAAKAISDLATGLPNSGGLTSLFSGDNTLSDFGEGLSEFGEYLVEYSDAVSGIDTETFLAIIPGLQSLVTLASDISSLNLDSVTAFGDAFTTLASDGVSGLVDTFTDSTEGIVDSINTLLEAIITAVEDQQDTFKTAGIGLIDKLIAGIKVKTHIVKNTFSVCIKQTVDTIRGYYDRFKSAGLYLVLGFSKGIDENTWRAEAAAKAMASAADTAAKNQLEQNSPSKVFYRIGAGTVEGFVNAMNDGRDTVYKSGTDLAKASIKGTSEAIKRLSAWMESDIDTQPTIRPVMDLTDVEAGARRLNSMLSAEHAYGIAARMRSADSENQNGSGNNGNSFNFVQNNYSPKPLSNIEIYRQTRNQISKMKGLIGAR